VILQCVRQGKRVLATAPSNVWTCPLVWLTHEQIAVDNLLEKLISLDSKLKLVRLGMSFLITRFTGLISSYEGHPARLLPSVLGHSVDALLGETDSAKLVADVRKELNALQR
jgi:hypothetical protein